MESLYLLIPLSLVLVLAIGGLLAWAVLGGQFEDLEREGQRILEDDPPPDADTAARASLQDRDAHDERAEADAHARVPVDPGQVDRLGPP